MRFKKQLISEEMGLTKNNKKTFTKGKKQKVVVSENQFQRLISILNEKTGCTPPPGCDDFDSETCQCNDETWLGQQCEKCSDGYSWYGRPGCGKCAKGGGGGHRGYSKELREGPNPPSSICGGCQNSPQGCISCQTGYAQAPATHPTHPCECIRASSLQRKRPTTNKGKIKEYTVKNIKEMRKLKTTQPIVESQINEMKQWFNRLGSTGTEYNPHIITEESQLLNEEPAKMCDKPRQGGYGKRHIYCKRCCKCSNTASTGGCGDCDGVSTRGVKCAGGSMYADDDYGLEGDHTIQGE